MAKPLPLRVPSSYPSPYVPAPFQPHVCLEASRSVEAGASASRACRRVNSTIGKCFSQLFIEFSGPPYIVYSLYLFISRSIAASSISVFPLSTSLLVPVLSATPFPVLLCSSLNKLFRPPNDICPWASIILLLSYIPHLFTVTLTPFH